MRISNAVLALVAVAALGGATGCDKQSPYITLTAHGVSVKARAVKYCRDAKCDEGKDNPSITVRAGDTLGIDVPRSVADQGWRIGTDGPFSHDHYRSIPITQGQNAGDVQLDIYRDETFGAGHWQFTVHVK